MRPCGRAEVKRQCREVVCLALKISRLALPVLLGLSLVLVLKAAKMTLFPNDLLTMACNRAGGALRPPRYLGLNHDQNDAA